VQISRDGVLTSANWFIVHTQVEELVAGSNTGKAPQLSDYYSYWEMAVFNALVLMVLKGLEKLHSMLTKKPMFKVSGCVSGAPAVGF
jgi:hypothetical protein